MLCFIFNRYQEFMDNLITSFMYHFRAFIQEAKECADEKEQEFLRNLTEELPHLGEFLVWYSSQEIKQNITAEEYRQLGIRYFIQRKTNRYC